MRLFIDSADPKQIKEIWNYGFIDGVTTNPSLAAKVGGSYKDIVEQIFSIVSGPISLETISTNWESIVEEGRALSKLNNHVVVKIPCTKDGYIAADILSNENVKVNMTLCFSVNQALLAAKVSATYVSPFVGRLDDMYDHAGDSLIKDIKAVFDNYSFKTKILAASIRDTNHVERVAILGADIATVPYEILLKMVNHRLTDSGLERFLKDWEDSKLQLPI